MAILISVFAFFPVSGTSLVDVVVFTVPFVAAIVGIRGRVLLGPPARCSYRPPPGRMADAGCDGQAGEDELHRGFSMKS